MLRGMPRGMRPTSAPRCIRCDLRDEQQLYAVSLKRHWHPRLPDGSRDRQHSVSIPTRICRSCAAELFRQRQQVGAWSA